MLLAVAAAATVPSASASGGRRHSAHGTERAPFALRTVALPLFAIWTALVCFSTVFNGFHYVSDVLSGVLLAVYVGRRRECLLACPPGAEAELAPPQGYSLRRRTF